MGKPTEKVVKKLAWEQEKGESNKNFEAFVTYLNLPGERTYEEVSRRLGVASPQYIRWAAKFRWKERAEAYDLWHEEKTQAVRHKALEKAAQDRAKEEVSDLSKYISEGLELQVRVIAICRKYLDKGELIGAFPISKQTVSDTKKVGNDTYIDQKTYEPTNPANLQRGLEIVKQAKGMIDESLRTLIAAAVGNQQSGPSQPVSSPSDQLSPKQVETANQQLDAHLEDYKQRIEAYQSKPPPILNSFGV